MCQHFNAHTHSLLAAASAFMLTLICSSNKHHHTPTYNYALFVNTTMQTRMQKQVGAVTASTTLTPAYSSIV